MSSEPNKAAKICSRAIRFLLVIAGVLLISGSGLSQQKSILIQGSVIEAGSQSPIDKVTVELRSSPENNAPALASSRTDSSGQFYLPIANPGSYRIVAVHPGHVPATIP